MHIYSICLHFQVAILKKKTFVIPPPYMWYIIYIQMYMAYKHTFDYSTYMYIYNSIKFHVCIKYIYFKNLHFNCEPLDFGGHFEK